MSEPKRIRVEINLTLACNAACPRCDRAVAEFPDRTDHMSIAQVETFIAEARARKDELFIERIKAVGGEPLVHPHFEQIFNLLADATEQGVFGFFKINTNCVEDPPAYTRGRRGVKWSRSPLKGKRHLPTLWHPKDLGLPAVGFCSHPRVCGFSLDCRGWLPCSPAIIIAGGFDLESLYRQEIPTEPWGIELCDHCVYALPKSFRKSHLGFTHVEPTPLWAAALRNYEKKRGDRVKMPVGEKANLISLPTVAA